MIIVCKYTISLEKCGTITISKTKCMLKKYDVVVIGVGSGGLTAAVHKKYVRVC